MPDKHMGVHSLAGESFPSRMVLVVPQQFNDSLSAEGSLESSTEFNIDTPLVWVVVVVCFLRSCFGVGGMGLGMMR